MNRARPPHMIRYALKCANGHTFDSWFASGQAFDMQQARGLVACPVCDSAEVNKTVMAPRIQPRSRPAPAADTAAVAPAPSRSPSPATAEQPDPAQQPPRPGKGPLSAPASEAERMVTELRQRIEAHTEDVGDRFASVARQMHDGEADARAIRGRASPDEARKLLEDGVPVLPLPFGPPRQVN